MTVSKATFVKGIVLDETRFAPYAGYTVFIIDDSILIFDEDIIEDFDIVHYKEIFDIIETID